MKNSEWSKCVNTKKIKQDITYYSKLLEGYRLCFKQIGYNFNQDEVLEALEKIGEKGRMQMFKLRNADYELIKMYFSK